MGELGGVGPQMPSVAAGRKGSSCPLGAELLVSEAGCFWGRGVLLAWQVYRRLRVPLSGGWGTDNVRLASVVRL